jgi:hypothetical protein
MTPSSSKKWSLHQTLGGSNEMKRILFEFPWHLTLSVPASFMISVSVRIEGLLQ